MPKYIKKIGTGKNARYIYKESTKKNYSTINNSVNELTKVFGKPTITKDKIVFERENFKIFANKKKIDNDRSIKWKVEGDSKAAKNSIVWKLYGG